MVPFCCVVLLVLLVGLAFSIDAQVSEVKEPKSATSGGPAGEAKSSSGGPAEADAAADGAEPAASSRIR
jgi:hypothetical protein